MSEHGYSGTPLWRKLGLKENYRLLLVSVPSNYQSLISPIPAGLQLSTRFRSQVDIVHAFVTKKAALVQALGRGERVMKRDGAIWISWPKRASGVPSEVTEDTIREVALPRGLVDIKVCAVDATWSGLKLVIRKENR
ncbi:MAG: DUF3052 family protein [Pseudomonadota bacterium]